MAAAPDAQGNPKPVADPQRHSAGSRANLSATPACTEQVTNITGPATPHHHTTAAESEAAGKEEVVTRCTVAAASRLGAPTAVPAQADVPQKAPRPQADKHQQNSTGQDANVLDNHGDGRGVNNAAIRWGKRRRWSTPRMASVTATTGVTVRSRRVWRPRRSWPQPLDVPGVRRQLSSQISTFARCRRRKEFNTLPQLIRITEGLGRT